MRYLDPSNDYVFKILFNEPSDEPRLIAMLTAILEPAVPIVSATVLNPQLPPDVVTAKAIVLDILVRLADGRRSGIEMEAFPRPMFIPREVYYWSRTHGGQLGAGEDYRKLRPTISIAWLANPRDGSRSIVGSDAVHSRYRILETETHRELTDHLEIHLLDLRNLATDGTLSPALRRWAEFFDHPTPETLERLSREDAIMSETIKKLEAVSTEEAHHLAEARFRGRFQFEMGMDYARAEGRAEGQREQAAASVLAVARARFGALPDDLLAKVATADLEFLTRVLPSVATVASRDDLEALFAR